MFESLKGISISYGTLGPAHTTPGGDVPDGVGQKSQCV